MAYLRQYPNGQWQVVIRRSGIPSQSATFATRRAAARWARQVETEIDQGLVYDRHAANRTTIGYLVDRYLREVTPYKKSARTETHRLKALKTEFGAFSVAALRNTHIAEYRDRRLAAGRAGATVLKELNSLSHLLDVAAKDWGIPMAGNPAKLVSRLLKFASM